jgi:hypothetical protein
VNYLGQNIDDIHISGFVIIMLITPITVGWLEIDLHLSPNPKSLLFAAFTLAAFTAFIFTFSHFHFLILEVTFC